MKHILSISMLIVLIITMSSCMKNDDSQVQNNNEPEIANETDEMIPEENDGPMTDEISGMVISDSYSLNTSAQNTITVNNFGEMKSISSPLTLTGTAPRKWFFEGSFYVALMTLSEEVVAEAPAEGAWLEPIDGKQMVSEDDMIEYSVTFEFDAPTKTDEGKIRFSSSNPSGEAENEDIVDTQIIFAEGGSEMTEEDIPEEYLEDENTSDESNEEETMENEEEVTEDEVMEEEVMEEETTEEDTMMEDEASTGTIVE